MPATTRKSPMEDLRRKRVTSNGEIQAICTLCEVEGRPYVLADYEYVAVSTLSGRDERITACLGHAEQLDAGTLSYAVARWRKGMDWDHPL
jgi:hypothetical protein